MPAAESLTELSSGWRLDAVDQSQPPLECQDVEFQIPGDVHSALLEHGLIDDPYYRDNELAIDWVNQTAWRITRHFQIDLASLAINRLLILDGVDCISVVRLNGSVVGRTDNQFVRYVFDIGQLLIDGQNTLSVEFDVARDVAMQRSADYPIELPGHNPNSRIDNNNFLRKTPCHSGWDWNICLMPVGVYGGIVIGNYNICRIVDVCFNQHHIDGDVQLQIDISVQAFRAEAVECRVMIGKQQMVQFEVDLHPGMQNVSSMLVICAPELWWPSGLGAQTRHEVSIVCADQHWHANVGFRQSRIVQTADTEGDGSGFAIEINGQSVFMRGANWIPADALPARATPESVRQLLQSAIDVNMNMLRVWGGGQYEADWFYALCDELGIMIWQDFMFSCNHYPAADAHWMASVRLEAKQQARRLSQFACVVLWCGDNELVGALKWWDVTVAHRDRYLANYVRLNTALEEVVAEHVPDIPWWPSSPSQGIMDYADGWKSDVAGDMHFWDVWHEAKPFSAYQEIRPRFCSEFGFQSFPSMPVIETFSEPADRNVSSSVMDIHQRNIGGNARIVETLVRYFAFPDSFTRIVFLSQCQQAMAITTAVEYWRSLKPRCMGTLYWQLNDTWPVASWSSLEYGGGWKLLHYAARRFYDNVLMVIVPVDRQARGDNSPLVLRAVNDGVHIVSLHYEIVAIDMEGSHKRLWRGDCQLGSEKADDILLIEPVDIPAACFLQIRWASRCIDGSQAHGICGTTEYWPAPYKSYDLPDAHICVAPASDGKSVTLSTDKPAFFVSLELGGRRVWSDNGFTLLPDQPRTLTLEKVLDGPNVPHCENYRVQHLAG